MTIIKILYNSQTFTATIENCQIIFISHLTYTIKYSSTYTKLNNIFGICIITYPIRDHHSLLRFFFKNSKKKIFINKIENHLYWVRGKKKNENKRKKDIQSKSKTTMKNGK